MMNLATAPNKLRAQQSRLIFDDTYNGRVPVMETTASSALADTLNGGTGPGPDENHNEIFYVVDGEVEVKSEIFQYTAKKGSYVIITPGQDLKSLKNNTNKKVSLLWL
ncbi:MAG TPA: cupin domain-containing protein [Mucilaginibacter sp.]|jgi:glyoxylate utilization-related uncharacterized protein